jgi:hypothetical protein
VSGASTTTTTPPYFQRSRFFEILQKSLKKRLTTFII